MKNISKALLEVQKGLDPVHKGRQGYGYKYADLPAVMDACLEGLNKAGIVVVQSPAITDKNAACVVTKLIHAESGEGISGVIEVPYGEAGKMSIAQAYGSAMTYARRYALVSMLGIVTEDDDGHGAGKKMDKKPPEGKKAEHSFEKKEPMAVDAANRLVTLYGDYGGGDVKSFRIENEAMIERCKIYPKAAKILEDGGIL